MQFLAWHVSKFTAETAEVTGFCFCWMLCALINRKGWSQVCKVGVVDSNIDIDLLVPQL